jgi:hypothetical protein
MVQYQTFDLQDSYQLNSRLYDLIHKNLTEPVKASLDGAFRTEFDLHRKAFFKEDGFEDLYFLLDWICSVMPKAAYQFTQGGDESTRGDSATFDSSAFQICSCWGIHYNKGQGVVKHNHFPCSISFSYCLTAPENSSPLILEDKIIDPVPGRVIFFPGHQYHSVPPNGSDGRCMIVGNVLYLPEGGSTISKN